jgi:hypothetical protein
VARRAPGEARPEGGRPLQPVPVPPGRGRLALFSTFPGAPPQAAGPLTTPTPNPGRLSRSPDGPWRGTDGRLSRDSSAPPGARGASSTAPTCMRGGRPSVRSERPSAPPRRCPAAPEDEDEDEEGEREAGPGSAITAAQEHGLPGGSSGCPGPGRGTRKQKRSHQWS